MQWLVLLALTPLAVSVRHLKKADEELTTSGSGVLSLVRLERTLKNAAFGSRGLATLKELGKTADNHSIWALRLACLNYTAATGKKLLVTFNLEPGGSVADAGIYAVHAMIRMTRESPSWLSGLELVLVPVANPDGYSVSHKYARSNWAKNAPAGNDYCRAVNINNNFPKGWVRSRDKCSHAYSGAASMSEKETQTLAREIGASTTMHINVGSTRALEVAVGYSCSGCGYPTSLAELFNLAGAMTKDMTAAYGRRHHTSMAGPSSGTITDYALSKGALAVQMETRSKAEILAGLRAAVGFLKGLA